MANRRVKNIRFVKQADAAVIPANPTAVIFDINATDVKKETTSEKKSCLGKREIKGMRYGTSDIAGSIKFDLSTENGLFLVTHAIGAPTGAATDATADAYATGVVVSKNDIVNHSNGTHTLYCTVGGTTVAEPTIAVDYDGEELDDGVDVKWIAVAKLMKYVGETADCLTAFVQEIEETDGTDCANPTEAYERFLGLFSNGLSISLGGDQTGVEVDMPLIGTAREDSDLDDTYEELSAKAGFTESTFKGYDYSAEDVTVQLNGVCASQTKDWSLELANGVTSEPAMCQTNEVNLGTPDASGTTNLKFDKDIYRMTDTHALQDFEIFIAKFGSSIKIFGKIEFANSSKNYETDKYTNIAAPYSFVGAVKYEIVTGSTY